MIKKATQLDFTNKKLKVLIAGYPGIGKTTLALSAPKPLLLDLDNGIDRVEAKYRSDTSVVQSYDELLADLASADLSEYETIVVDTGGKLLELMKPKVISEDIKNGQRDGNLTLKGYGAVSRLFAQFIQQLDKLNKHLVIIFHAKEDKDGDEVRLRIQVEGSTKDSIWQSMDLGGFVEMRGKNRIIGFSNCEKYFAKGTHGINGTYEIPDLNTTGKNTFLTDMFTQAITDLNKEVESYTAEKELYDESMTKGNKSLEFAVDAETLNKAVQTIAKLTHGLTSRDELRFKVGEKAKSLGLTWDKAVNKYVPGNNDTAK
jgi:hypothetical protein